MMQDLFSSITTTDKHHFDLKVSQRYQCHDERLVRLLLAQEVGPNHDVFPTPTKWFVLRREKLKI